MTVGIEVPAWLASAYDQCKRSVPGAARKEEIAVEDACGRVAAEAVTAREKVPRVLYADGPGEAIRSSESSGASPHAPVKLEIDVGEAALLKFGANPEQRQLQRGHAQFIWGPGLPLPGGADTVAPDRNAAGDGPAFDYLCLTEPVAPGQGVLMPGHDCEPGTVLLQRGERITPQKQAMLVAAGVRSLPVTRRPRIVVAVASYDLLPLDAPREAWERPDSNGPYIRAMLQQWGYQVPCVEYLPLRNSWLRESNPDSTYPQYVERLKVLVADYDLIVGTGMPEPNIAGVDGFGISLGFPSSRAPVQIQQRPGGRFIVRRGYDRSPPFSEIIKFYDSKGILRASQCLYYEDQAVLVDLPGFTSNVGVLMHVFLRRILDELEHVSNPGPHWQVGRVAHDVTCDSEVHQMLWGTAVTTLDGQIVLSAPQPQHFDQLSVFANATALIAIPSGHEPLAAGAKVSFLPI